MRSLSDLEKSIVKRLFTSANNGDFVGNCIYSFSNVVNLTVDHQTKSASLRFYFSNQDRASQMLPDVIEEAHEYIAKYATLGKLLNYLDSQNLITCYSLSNNHQNQKVEYTPTLPHGKAIVSMEFDDKAVNKTIIKYQQKTIIVTEELKEIVDHGFRTKADRRHSVTSKLGVIGIIVAVGISVASEVSTFLRTGHSDTGVTNALEYLREAVDSMNINQEAIHLHQIEDILKDIFKDLTGPKVPMRP